MIQEVSSKENQSSQFVKHGDLKKEERHDDLKGEEKWWEKKDSNYDDYAEKLDAANADIKDIERQMAELAVREAEARKQAAEARNTVE